MVQKVKVRCKRGRIRIADNQRCFLAEKLNQRAFQCWLAHKQNERGNQKNLFTVILSLSFRHNIPPRRNPTGVLLPIIHSTQSALLTSKFFAHRKVNPSIHSGVRSQVFLCKLEMAPGLRALVGTPGERQKFGGKKVFVDVDEGAFLQKPLLHSDSRLHSSMISNLASRKFSLSTPKQHSWN